MYVRDLHELYLRHVAEGRHTDPKSPVAFETWQLQKHVKYPDGFDFDDLMQLRKHFDGARHSYPVRVEDLMALRERPLEQRVLAAIYDRLCTVRDSINFDSHETHMLCVELLQTLIDVSKVFDDALTDEINRTPHSDMPSLM